MTHCVTGIIAKPSLLEAFSRKHGLHIPVPLPQGLAILPLRDEDIDAFLSPPLSGYSEGFTQLSVQLADFLADASSTGTILYFETEYFGGMGAQGAAVFSAGKLIMPPTVSEFGPINKGLSLLSVFVSHGAYDEFESIGLGRHRLTEEWIKLQV